MKRRRKKKRGKKTREDWRKHCVLLSDWSIKALIPFLVESGRKGAEGYNIITNNACFLKVISNSEIL